MNPEDFWTPFEGHAGSFAEATKLIFDITEEEPGRLFAWRGVADAAWPLHSSLYRRLLWTQGHGHEPPTEEELCEAEKRVVGQAQSWGLHSGDRGRLSMFEFLATLQHYGAPTRFIDVTFNPYAALFFATEQASHDGKDGRIFAIEVTGRLLNGHEDQRLQAWEKVSQFPWNVENLKPDRYWGHASYVWKPSGFDRRIAAQHGAFLIGGVPASKKGAWPKSPSSPSAKWKIAEVRSATSVPVRPHKINPSMRQHPKDGQAVYSFRISASAKMQIRNTLDRTFSLNHAAIYPDFPGFAAFGVDWLLTKPR